MLWLCQCFEANTHSSVAMVEVFIIYIHRQCVVLEVLGIPHRLEVRLPADISAGFVVQLSADISADLTY